MRKYSVDMIRLEVKVNVADFESFMNSNKQCLCDDMDYFQSFRRSDYRHLWKVKQTGNMREFSYSVMFQHNMENPSMYHNLVVEFNPNKCDYDGFLKLLISRFYGSRSLVKQIDLACDVDIPIESIVYTNHGRQYVSIIDSGSGKTMYFGKRGYGQVKVYDKAAEQGLPDRIVLTRIEKTIKIDRGIKDSYGYDFSKEMYPALFVPDILDTLLPELDVKDTLMLLGLRQRPDLISRLSKDTRRKYSKLLEQKQIEMDDREMSKAYVKCLNTIAKDCFGLDTFR